MGQKMQIEGTVIDTTANKPMPNALAMLVRIKDSVLIDFKRTDQTGMFGFYNLPLDTLQLIVSHPKMGEREYYFFGRQDNSDFLLKKIILPEKSTMVDEITIYAYKDPIYYKGDTLVYVADSFATKPNAVVEDLLKKLPGITVDKDGKIKSQGKEISQVLVDGDEFFGADPTMATKNLAAKGVESVQVYEKKNEDAAAGDETIQVLDLKLKDEAKKGYFGKASFATDFRKFYEGELLANKFNKKQKISAFLLTSNTMRSSLDWRDSYKYGIEQSNAYSYNSETDSWEMNEDYNSNVGFPTTFKSGIYYDDQVSKKLKLGANYTYTNNSLKVEETNRSQYFLQDTTYVTNQNKLSTSKNESHQLNISVKYDIDSLTTLEFEPKLKINKASRDNNDLTSFVSENGNTERQTNVNNSSDADGTNLKTRLALTRKFKKTDRKLSITNNFVSDQNSSEGTLHTLDDQISNPLFSDTIDQRKKNRTTIVSNVFNTVYTEPLSKKFKLELDYELFNTLNKQSKKTFNFENGSYSDLDSMYTNEFETSKMQNRIGAALIYEFKKHTLIAGVRYRNVIIENQNLINNVTINQNINNLLPRLVYTYKFSQNSRLRVNYSTASMQPTINQLQPVNDNLNPNRIIIGNPDLRPNYSHNGSVSYQTYKPISGTYMWASWNHRMVQNDFVGSVIYDEFGRSITQTVNSNGTLSSNLYMGAGFPLYKQVLKLNPNVNGGIFRYNSFVNNQKNQTINQSIGLGLNIDYETDSLEFSIGGNFDYRQPKSTLSASMNQPFYVQTYSAELKIILPFRFGIESDATYTINSKRAEGYNINYLIWNATVTRSFGKLENWIAGVSLYDILNQNINANRINSAVITTDTKTNIIARYFMLKLTYKFNSSKIKDDDNGF